MKNNITKVIASATFGLMISATVIASEEDYGDDIFISENNIQEVYISNVSFDKMVSDEVSFLDINHLTND